VKAAAKKLAEQKNYSWKTTVVVPEGSQFRPGPTEGKTEKEGYTLLSMSLRDNTMEAVLKGEKGAAKVEGEWRSLAEMAEEGQGMAASWPRGCEVTEHRRWRLKSLRQNEGN